MRVAVAERFRVRMPSPVAGNSVDLLKDGGEAYPRMLDAIRAARNFVLLETYHFAGDHVASWFADALCERARSGISVFVLYDAAGSYDTPRAIFDSIRAGGVRVVAFHPFSRYLRRVRIRR